MDNEQIKNLLEKYILQQCTEEELQKFDQWYQSLDKIHGKELPDEYFGDEEAYGRKMLQKFRTMQENKEKTLSRKRPLYIRYAAAVIIFIGLSAVIFYAIQHNKSNATHDIVAKNDVPPGYNGAILTLADGKHLILDSTKNGSVITQGNAQVTNNAGQLTYDVVKNTSSAGIAYNTLSTPRARQYSLILPDGTKVMLNAESTIRYPTAFNGRERLVELTGEGYFEVVHNARKPFKVKVNNLIVEDVGTSFNIDAYNDESAIKTTLIRGSINVVSNTSNLNIFLKPGQQAIAKDNKLLMIEVDTSQVLAWKEGFFEFENADLLAISKQLSRWYNIQIIFKGPMSQRKFFGRISRNMNLSQVLKVLQQNQVHFEIEPDNKLIIKPK